MKPTTIPVVVVSLLRPLFALLTSLERHRVRGARGQSSCHVASASAPPLLPLPRLHLSVGFQQLQFLLGENVWNGFFAWHVGEYAR